MAERKIPGAAVAVIRAGRLVAAEGFGFRSLEERLPFTPATVMPLASVSKSFTALALIQLVAEGRLALTDPVVRHLPSFRVRDQAATDSITVAMLLAHRSGIGRSGHMDDHWKEPDSPYPTRLALAEGLGEYELQAPPGELYSYSNEGYVIAGALVDRLSHGSYEQHIASRIFGPLGMTASLTDLADWRKAPDRASVYVLTPEGTYRPGRIMQNGAVGLPAGLLCSSALDLARYLIATMHDTASPLLPGHLLGEMQRVWAPYGDTGWGYGLGWRISHHAGRKVVSHGGSLDGVATHLYWLPEERLGVVVLTNLALAPSGRMAEEVAATYLGEGVLRPSPLDPLPFRTQALPPPADQLAALAGAYAGKTTDLLVSVSGSGLALRLTTRETGLQEEFPVEAIGPLTFMARTGGWEATPIYFRRGAAGEVDRVIASGSLFLRRPGPLPASDGAMTRG